MCFPAFSKAKEKNNCLHPGKTKSGALSKTFSAALRAPVFSFVTKGGGLLGHRPTHFSGDPPRAPPLPPPEAQAWTECMHSVNTLYTENWAILKEQNASSKFNLGGSRTENHLKIQNKYSERRLNVQSSQFNVQIYSKFKANQLCSRNQVAPTPSLLTM